MSNKNSCVAIFKSHQEAELAIKELAHAKFDMQKLSIIGKGYEQEENVLGYYNGLDRVKRWGKRGALWGGLWGLLFSPVFVCAPAAGTFILVVSGVSTAIVSAGLTSLGAALYSIGIPKNSIIHYETAIKLKKHLLIVRGTRAEVEQARDILDMTKNLEVAVHSA